MADNMPVHVWRVFKVEDAFGPASLGGSNRMKRVWYRMANDDESYVDVPYSPNWDTEASKLIERDVETHVGALGLKSMETM